MSKINVPENFKDDAILYMLCEVLAYQQATAEIYVEMYSLDKEKEQSTRKELNVTINERRLVIHAQLAERYKQ